MSQWVSVGAMVALLLLGWDACSPSALGEVGAAAELKPVSARLVRSFRAQGEELELVKAALLLDPTRPSRRERRATLREIEELAARVQAAAAQSAAPEDRIAALNRVLFAEEHLTGHLNPHSPLGLSLGALLEKRRGTCVSLVILYLALAQAAGLDASAAATPTHLYVQVKSGHEILNVETLEGGRLEPGSTLRRRHPVSDESIERGVFLAPLSKQELLGHLMSNRGVLAAKMGDHDAALEEFAAAIFLHPELNAAYYNRGLSHLALGMYETATEDFTRAISLHPLDAQAYNNRGVAHIHLGKATEAREDFESALRINPVLKEARENLEALESRETP